MIAVDAAPQLIECAPRQALYTDEPEARFTARIRSHRVNRCHVSVDVTAREGFEPLAGPWRLSLTHGGREQAFRIDGWPDGEYWIRLRVVVDGSPTGPFCVRKFWKQAPLPGSRPAVLDLTGHPEVLVDDYCFDAVRGVRFVPDPFERPAAPVVDGSAAHEEEGLQFTSVEWIEEAGRWEAHYENFLVAGDRLDDHDTRAGLRMLAVSPDGRTWTRPELGAVAYAGSTLNNILSDDRGPRTQRERELEHDIEHATFRFYDERRDGPVDLDGVFIASGKGRFPFACKSLQIGESAATLSAAERNEVPGMRQDGLGVLGDAAAPEDGAFRPRPGEFWPFEKRGDEYLVLSREPVLYLGIGMDLMHTTESMRCHVERVGARRRLFWYFRPGSPAYPPHGAECDNMHMCLRCLGVMWTDDGLTYHRRFALGPDAFDRTGTQFYAMGMLQRFGTSGDAGGRPVLDKLDGKINQAFVDRTLYLGSALLHHGIEQTQDPELIWTRDLLHFHRFRDGRRPLVERGPGGSFDCGMLRDRYRYVERNGEWLYAYVGINTRHNGYGIMAGDFRDAADLRERRPSHALASYFSTWEGHWPTAGRPATCRRWRAAGRIASPTPSPTMSRAPSPPACSGSASRNCASTPPRNGAAPSWCASRTRTAARWATLPVSRATRSTWRSCRSRACGAGRCASTSSWCARGSTPFSCKYPPGGFPSIVPHRGCWCASGHITEWPAVWRMIGERARSPGTARTPR